MSATAERPMAFYHQDGLVPAWNFARAYAGKSGHIATLPEIIELRLGASAGVSGSPWETWYASASAEYVGVGADGRVKIIVTHGVNPDSPIDSGGVRPMSTIDDIKAAYKWEWGDKSRGRRGGRITIGRFRDLEAGYYGEVKHIKPSDLTRRDGKVVRTFDIAPVNVLDFQDYLDAMGLDDDYSVFYRYQTAIDALRDPLIRMRLGSNAYRYLMKHERIAKQFHARELPNGQTARRRHGFDEREHPYITKVEGPSNCWYLQRNEVLFRETSRWVDEPRIPEEGYAFAHLLGVDSLMRTHTQEVGVGLMSSPSVHEWSDGAKFVAVPEGATMNAGIASGPDASELIREHWKCFMQSVEEGHTPVLPYLLEHTRGEWFTHYPKKLPGGHCMDDGNTEFHVRSATCVGGDGYFTIDEPFFLRYKLAQVRRIMPREANAYEILDVSGKDRDGLTTVRVRFYVADVDTSRRLPRAEELARDYDRLMEVHAH
mgnify:CR=1 FL=1|tara:strand:+ start:4010 stop:5467 length:1458 start_codon:yes stop_codon:yes gene_type:complete